MNWPFELPIKPRAYATKIPAMAGGGDYVRTEPDGPAKWWEPLYDEDALNACIASALRWAAEQCELEASKLAFVPTKGVATDCRDRILAALPKDE